MHQSKQVRGNEDRTEELKVTDSLSFNLTTNGIFPLRLPIIVFWQHFFFILAISFSLSSISYFSPVFVINSYPGLRFLLPEHFPLGIRETWAGFLSIGPKRGDH